MMNYTEVIMGTQTGEATLSVACLLPEKKEFRAFKSIPQFGIAASKKRKGLHLSCAVLKTQRTTNHLCPYGCLAMGSLYIFFSVVQKANVKLFHMKVYLHSANLGT